MARFLSILVIVAFSASQRFATPVDLVVTGGDMTTEVNTSGPTSADDSVLAAMPLSTSSTVILGSTSSAATYNFTNAAGLASFDIRPVAQALVADNFSFGFSSFAIGTISFQLNEAADYSVTGTYSGSSNSENEDYQSFSELRDDGNSSIVFVENELSRQFADHVVNGIDDGNTVGGQVAGLSTGTLLPGNYRFRYQFILANVGFEVGIGDAAGFVNLTLTRVIPEPASAVLMLLGLGAALASHRSSRK